MSSHQNEASPVMQQVGMLNLRINDMLTQLNAVMKTMMDENAALKKENTELKTKQEKAASLKKTCFRASIYLFFDFFLLRLQAWVLF